MRRFALALVAALTVLSPAKAQGPVGLQPDVVFDAYTPLAGNAVLLERTLSPIAAALAAARLATTRQTLPEQSVDLRQARFALYVPPVAPPQGYGVLVFVPPWEEAMMPAGWGKALDAAGVIYVSPAKSGNAASVPGRREPLALLALANVQARYKVDPARVYVGGFSGGSRVAMRIALAYPDVFRGALLNAGADPIGAGAPTIPPRALMARFQTQTRLVYVTGAYDQAARTMDAASQASMRRWCVQDIDSETMIWSPHTPPNAAALTRALAALDQHAAPDAGKLAACRAGIERELSSALQHAEQLSVDGKADEARKALLRIDESYGWFAAPRSVSLARACRCGLL